MSALTYYNDVEHFPCEVLRKNIKLGNLPEGYVDERDIREIHATDIVGYQHIHLFAGIGAFPLGFQWAGVPDYLRIITGGFPCQDISNAGKRAGLEGEHSGLWFEMHRLIQEAIDSGMGPDYVCIENVAAITGRGLSRVLADLAQTGFDAEWQCLRASDFGAPHQRERIFIVAYPMREGQSPIRNRLSTWTNNTISTPSTKNVADFSGIRSNSWRTQPERQQRETYTHSNGSSELADPQSTECQRTGNTWARRTRFTDSSASVADASSTGQQKRNTPTIADEERHASWRTRSPGSTGQSQSCLGRVFAWLPSKLDRSYWPAGPGEQQYSWEPPRTVTGKQPNRVARLKALGNSIVPQITEYIGHCIITREQINTEMEDGGAA